MGKSKRVVTIPPTIINVFKPARMTSYDVIRHFKKNLPDGYGKIGHFGTLDPFACGVLMIGVAGAARLNDYIHDYSPKTYLAVGKLGVQTDTGDLTEEIIQKDDTAYLKETISKFDCDFIEQRLRDNFLGNYWQSPHKYSAAKFEGKPLHFWARSGVDIQKEKVLRVVHDIKVVKYEFPYLSVEVTVSSGTYVRTLFSDFAFHLGTIGALVSLVRKNVGEVKMSDSIKKNQWPQEKNFDYNVGCSRPDEVLKFPKIQLNEKHAMLFCNGVILGHHQFDFKRESLVWVYDEQNSLLGLGSAGDHGLKVQVNFSVNSL